MRFLIDENVHQGLVLFLKELGHDARRSPKGISNGEVLSLSISEDRILITHDTDFSKDEIIQGHPGIALLRIPPRDLEVLKTALSNLLAEKKSANLFKGKLFLIYPGRWDEFPFVFKEFPL